MTGAVSTSVTFGPFKLSPATRTLEKDGITLTLGDRALDILILLIERPGTVVSHKELISRVWRGLVVSPNSLRVHVTGLRKALGDGEGRDRYIANVVGQGYSFVAPLTRESSPAPEQDEPALPAELTRMVGREDSIRIISADRKSVV